MQVVERVLKVRRGSEAERGRVVADDLVAPGAVVRVLHDRHQLDVRKAELLNMISQWLGNLAVAQRVAVRLLHPRDELYLIRRDGRLQRFRTFARPTTLSYSPV